MIHPHMDHTAAFPLHIVLLSFSPQHKDLAYGEKTPWTSYIPAFTPPIPIHLGFVLSTWTYEGPDHSLDNLCHQDRANINVCTKISTQSEVVIGIWCSFILKHYPFEPFKLTEWAYVGCLSRHNGFRDFPIQFVNSMCSIGPNVGFKFKAIIPKSHWGTKLNELPTRTFLQFLYLSLNCISNDVMFPWVFCWTCQLSFLWHCHKLWSVAPHCTEREGTMPHELHFSTSLEMSMTSQSLLQKSVWTYCLS